jgi:hypothetical protein
VAAGPAGGTGWGTGVRLEPRAAASPLSVPGLALLGVRVAAPLPSRPGEEVGSVDAVAAFGAGVGREGDCGGTVGVAARADAAGSGTV